MLDIFVGVPEAVPILASAHSLLGTDPGEFLRTASDAALHENRTSQILCVTRALAAAACLGLPSPLLVAGYSVGEIAAWGITGFWSPTQTLQIVARRAELMDAAGGGEGGLGFIRGLDLDKVATLLGEFDCAIAIINPGQVFVIGGQRVGVEQCCNAALAAGAQAARPIAVHVASHTPLLASAVAPFRAHIEANPLSRPAPGRALIGAATASLVRGMPDLPGLAEQIGATIDWATVLEALIERGVDHVLELGPGMALADMARTAHPKLKAHALDEFKTLASAARWIR